MIWYVFLAISFVLAFISFAIAAMNVVSKSESFKTHGLCMIGMAFSMMTGVFSLIMVIIDLVNKFCN
ncbi:MAG: hypothetical protein ACOC80_14245 [Petrotogales bacterium]